MLAENAAAKQGRAASTQALPPPNSPLLAMVHIFIAVLGFLVLLLLLTEEFRDALKRVWHRLTSRPVGKYAAYPLAVALGLTAAGLIFLALWFFLSTTFSYD